MPYLMNLAIACGSWYGGVVHALALGELVGALGKRVEFGLSIAGIEP